MKPRYFQIGLESKVGPPRDMRSNGGGLKVPCNLEKIKDFCFAMFHDKTESCKKRQNDVITTKEVHIRNRK